jgi:hypothetical protein
MVSSRPVVRENTTPRPFARPIMQAMIPVTTPMTAMMRTTAGQKNKKDKGGEGGTMDASDEVVAA